MYDDIERARLRVHHVAVGRRINATQYDRLREGRAVRTNERTELIHESLGKARGLGLDVKGDPALTTGLGRPDEIDEP